MAISNLKKACYLFFGLVSIGLGVIGIFVPLMPTTIFLIIAAWLFFWADESYIKRLTMHKTLGPLIQKIPQKFLPKDVLHQSGGKQNIQA